MSVLFTSDLHLGHRLVAEHRGFASTDEHDHALGDRWARVVRPDDVVYVLGDVTLRNPATTLDVMRSWPGRKRLIWGNHDAGHPMHRDAHKRHAAYSAIFESVAQSARTRLHGTEILLSHFPYERDRGEVRHMQWRLPDLGAPLLHGHTHGRERVSRSAAGTLELHVGVDAWDLAPVNADVLHDLLLSQEA